jgi:hypothetical protein
MGCDKKGHQYDKVVVYDKPLVDAMNNSIKGLAFRCNAVKHKGCRQ